MRKKRITEKQLIRLAELGYGNMLPKDYEQARKHEIGDGLADFIVIELHETTDGLRDYEKIDEAMHAMKRAIEQLQSVLCMLEIWKFRSEHK